MYEDDYVDYGYESIEDIARGEGFYIDDDGHWMPLPDDYDYTLDCDFDSNPDF